MKKPHKFYMVFVKTSMLDKHSTIVDRLWENGCGENSGCPELLLFAVTTKKKRLEDFFIIHKKELFEIRVMGANEAKECYGRMSTSDHYYYQENDFSDIQGEREFSAQLSPYWMEYHNVQVIYERKGRFEAGSIELCISADEYDIIMSGQSMENEDLHIIYQTEKFMNFLVDNIFSKKVVKYLKAIHYKELQAFARHLYGPAGEPIPNIEYNEYGDLLRYYHEVLIGGTPDGKCFI